MPELRLAHLTTAAMSLELLLGSELDEGIAAGHTVFGISAPDPYVAQVEARGVTHVPIHAFTPDWDLRCVTTAARELAARLRDLRLDVLHTHGSMAGVLGRVMGRAMSIPVVVNTCHCPRTRPEDPPVKRALARAAERLAALCSDAELHEATVAQHAHATFDRRAAAAVMFETYGAVARSKGYVW